MTVNSEFAIPCLEFGASMWQRGFVNWHKETWKGFMALQNICAILSEEENPNVEGFYVITRR